MKDNVIALQVIQHPFSYLIIKILISAFIILNILLSKFSVF